MHWRVIMALWHHVHLWLPSLSRREHLLGVQGKSGFMMRASALHQVQATGACLYSRGKRCVQVSVCVGGGRGFVLCIFYGLLL
jgi:hypothetical protein